MDPYKTLGVEPGTSDEEIKKAYKRLALEWHPDRHQGDKVAEEKFKEINVAYQLLKDGKYDSQMAGNSFVDVNDLFGRLDLDQMFQQAFGGNPFFGSRNARSVKRGEMHISLEDAHSGCQKKLKIGSEETCLQCKGTGLILLEDEKCGACGGSGQIRKVMGAVHIATSCAYCHGFGSKPAGVCQVCSGKGRILKSEEMTVFIPAGVLNGQRIRVRPDLEVTVLYLRHPDFSVLDGFSIGSNIAVSLFDAMLGISTDVKTLSGTRKVRINPGTQPNSILRIRGGGIGGKGDHLIEVAVELPKNLNDEQQQILKLLQDSLGKGE